MNVKTIKTYFQGILITGGSSQYDGHILPSAEVYMPELDRSCSLPNLTLSRNGHTQDSFLSCGGTGTNGTETETTCEAYIPGDTWIREPYILTQRRSWHTSWTLNNGTVILLGGKDSSKTTEAITPEVGTDTAFFLTYSIQ